MAVLFCTVLADHEAISGRDGSPSARATPVQRRRHDWLMSRMDPVKAGGRIARAIPKCPVHRGGRKAGIQPRALLTGALRPMPKARAAHPGIPVTGLWPLVCLPCVKAFLVIQTTPPKPKRKGRRGGPPPSRTRCCGICETEFDESQFEAMSPQRWWRPCMETPRGCNKVQWAHESCCDCCEVRV